VGKSAIAEGLARATNAAVAREGSCPCSRRDCRHQRHPC